MNKNYFPHSDSGSLNPTYTFPIGYNFIPENAVTIDPRYIIAEWSENALKSLYSNEIYIGQQIYCLYDKTCRVCRWLPDAPKFTAYNCIWDITYSPDATNNWINVSTYTPEETIEEKIEKAENKIWQLNMNPNNGYWGFYQFNTLNPTKIKDRLNNEFTRDLIMNEIMLNQGNNDKLTNSIPSLKMNAGTKSVSAPETKTKASYADAKGKVLLVMIPDYKKVKMTALNVNNTAKQTENLQVFEGNLTCMSPDDKCYDYKSYGYKIYAWTNDTFKDDQLTITYTLEKI